MIEQHHFSERHACRLVGLSRDSYRHPPQPSALSLSSGRRLKCLTVVDDFSKESVEIAVDYGISGQYVTRVLDQVARFRGYPAAVRTDNVLNARGVPTNGNSIACRSSWADRQIAKSDEQNRRRGSAAQGSLG